MNHLFDQLEEGKHMLVRPHTPVQNIKNVIYPRKWHLIVMDQMSNVFNGAKRKIGNRTFPYFHSWCLNILDEQNTPRRRYNKTKLMLLKFSFQCHMMREKHFYLKSFSPSPSASNFEKLHRHFKTHCQFSHSKIILLCAKMNQATSLYERLERNQQDQVALQVGLKCQSRHHTKPKGCLKCSFLVTGGKEYLVSKMEDEKGKFYEVIFLQESLKQERERVLGEYTLLREGCESYYMSELVKVSFYLQLIYSLYKVKCSIDIMDLKVGNSMDEYRERRIQEMEGIVQFFQDTAGSPSKPPQDEDEETDEEEEEEEKMMADDPMRKSFTIREMRYRYSDIPLELNKSLSIEVYKRDQTAKQVARRIVTNYRKKHRFDHRFYIHRLREEEYMNLVRPSKKIVTDEEKIQDQNHKIQTRHHYMRELHEIKKKHQWVCEFCGGLVFYNQRRFRHHMKDHWEAEEERKAMELREERRKRLRGGRMRRFMEELSDFRSKTESFNNSLSQIEDMKITGDFGFDDSQFSSESLQIDDEISATIMFPHDLISSQLLADHEDGEKRDAFSTPQKREILKFPIIKQTPKMKVFPYFILKSAPEEHIRCLPKRIGVFSPITRLGRSSECDVVLGGQSSDTLISRVHCLIQMDILPNGDCTVVVRDNKSSHGTFIEHEHGMEEAPNTLTPNPRPLEVGDIILLGRRDVKVATKTQQDMKSEYQIIYEFRQSIDTK